MKSKNEFYSWLAETGGVLLEVVKYLKELGIDPMALVNGRNLLQLAVQKGGNLEVVKYITDIMGKYSK